MCDMRKINTELPYFELKDALKSAKKLSIMCIVYGQLKELLI